MKKQILSLTFLTILILVSFSCEEDENNNTNQLPTEFPLEVGNAWVYERNDYENGAVDTSYLDTLYIAGKHQDYFLYSWNPKEYYSLVKNSDNKLICYGSIKQNDTTFFDKASIWYFYGKTGCLDSTSFANYYYKPDMDSACISVDKNREYFGEKWNTYIMKKTFEFDDEVKTLTYYNKIGLVDSKVFNNENNNLITEKIIIKELKNVNPPELSNDAKEEGLKTSKDYQTHIKKRSLIRHILK